jgi:hypothetical protein
MSFLTKNGRLAGILAAATTLATVLGVRPVLAFSQGDLVSGGSIWLETTIAVALVFVMSMAFSLQIARGYFVRNLEKFTLRLGADIWWLGYVMIRDGLIFMSFIMGLMVFFPGTFQDYPLAVPFMPLSVVLFGAALVTKLYFDADESRNAFRAVTVMIFLGTLLWISGVVFVTETPLALNPLPSGVSSTTGIWYSFYATFSSTANINLAMQSFYACFAALSVIGLFGFAHPILHSRIGGKKLLATRTGQGPAAPAFVPARAALRSAANTTPERPAQAPDSLRAETHSQSERVDYIQ